MAAWLTRVLRHPVARWAGLALGLIAIGSFVRTVAASGDAGAAWQRYDLGDIGLGTAAFFGFEIVAIVTLHLLGGTPAPRIWATSQLMKYLPVPASAALGMTGETIRQGHEPRRAFRLLIDHSLLLVGGAGVLGTPQAAQVLSTSIGVPWLVGAAAGTVAAAGLLTVATRGLALRRRLVLAVLAVLAWAIASVGMAAAFPLGPDGPSIASISSAFAAAWVAGQLVVPVPAGLGIREVALLVLVAGAPDSDVAAFALATRLAQVCAEGVLFLGVAADHVRRARE